MERRKQVIIDVYKTKTLKTLLLIELISKVNSEVLKKLSDKMIEMRNFEKPKNTEDFCLIGYVLDRIPQISNEQLEMLIKIIKDNTDLDCSDEILKFESLED